MLMEKMVDKIEIIFIKKMVIIKITIFFFEENNVKLKSKISTVLLIVLFISYVVSIVFISKNNTGDLIKKVNTNLVKRVNPIGRTIGLKLYTNGVLVVGMSEIENENGEKSEPYKNTGIKEGDMIKSINNINIENTQQLIDLVNQSNGEELFIKYQRNLEETFNTKIKPIKTKEGNYMLGLWVRDAAAGIGTLTYYDEEEGKFAALGHGIEDVDTGNLLNIQKGEIVTSEIISIVKGIKEHPGEIRGIIDNGEKIGDIEKNTDIGIYGNVTNREFIDSIKLPEVSIATRNQIKIGKAKIYCQLSNEGIQEFEIEIKKIYKNNYSNNKSMLIKITDEDLIKTTGGIIPGMSGTPIIQDNKFVGAITNVLLNDPTQGYAIFADMMIK